MNRRNFLKLGIASSTAIILLQDLPDDYEIPSQPYVNGVTGFEYMSMLGAYGRGVSVSEFCTVTAYRPNGSDLIRLDLNAYGGMSCWNAPYGSEIYGEVLFKKSSPNVIYEAVFLGSDNPRLVVG
jgi:hypothetical protein